MPTLAGVRQTLAAIGVWFCFWRADTATERGEIWEKRAAAIREWGEV